MPITANDIKIMRSEVLLDTPDGGGAMTGAEVVDGVSNNLFPDVSDLDRAYGRIALRKAFAGVFTSTVESYYGTTVIITERPQDPLVDVSLFSTGSWFDQREAARSRVEQYLAPGIRWPGHLAETQLLGARAIQIVVQLNDPIPEVGASLYLVANEGKSNQYFQYVRVKKVTVLVREFIDVYWNNARWIGKLVSIEITDPLRYTFVGIAPTMYSSAISNANAVLRETIISDSAYYYGMTDLKQSASLGDLNIQAKSIWTQIVPSAQSEVPLTDLNISGTSASAYAAGPNLTVSYASITLSSNASLFLGTSPLPGSVRLTLNGESYYDAAGVLRAVVGDTSIGTVDYTGGIVRISDAGNFTCTQAQFVPAAIPVRATQSAAIPVLLNERGYVYVLTLQPSPQPLGLIVSYRAQGKWYDMRDVGIVGSTGKLAGADASIGVGSINYSTGTVSLTLGALPDVGSHIVFTWTTPSNFQDRTAQTIQPVFKIKTANGGLVPSQTYVLFPVSGGFRIIRDNGVGGWLADGKIATTSDVSAMSTQWGTLANAPNLVSGGTCRYSTGDLSIRLATLPLGGAEFSVKYNWGTKTEESFSLYSTVGSPPRIELPLAGTNLIPETVEVEWNTFIIDYETVSQTPAELQIFGKRDPVHIVRDDGAGMLRNPDGFAAGWANSSIDYVTGQIVWRPDLTISMPKPRYAVRQVGRVAVPQAAPSFDPTSRFNAIGSPVYRNTFTHIEYYNAASLYDSSQSYIKVRYHSTAGATTAVETFATGLSVGIDLTDRFAERVVAGSVRFTMGGRTYIDRLGFLYTDINNFTGAGTSAGTINYTTGEAEVSVWTAGNSSAVGLQSLLTESSTEPADYVIFRIPASPIRTGSVQILGTRVDGSTFNQTADTAGYFPGPDIVGRVDYDLGLVELRFGSLVDAAGVTGEPWYDASAVDPVTGKIFKPRPVYLDTLRYNAVSYTYLPLDANILGLDPVRLPPDGRVPIFRVGDVAVIHHEDITSVPSPVADLQVDVGRVRLSTVVVKDNTGSVVAENRYSADLDAGIITFAPNFLIGTNPAPFKIHHRVEDMALVSDVQINGWMALTRPLTHDYPANDTKISSALVVGDLQARVDNAAFFAQGSWTSVWQDSRIGADILPKYNKAVNPFVVTNDGAIQERWVIVFDSSTVVRIIGESIGQLSTSFSITGLIAPINPATGVPYFQIPAAGWGAGWTAGHCLRFNTMAANYPVWLARTVLQGPPTVLNGDGFKFQTRGNIDRP